MEHSTVRDLLDTLAETAQPPTTVDIARAAAAGRRTVRLRRAVAAGSAALLTAAVAVLVSVVASGTAAVAPQPAPADSMLSAGPTAVAPPAQAPSVFDPMVQYADFGWLPDWLTSRLTITGSTSLSLLASQAGGVPCSAADPSQPPGCGVGGVPGSVALTVVPTGHSIPSASTPGAADAEDRAIAPINGRPARLGNPKGGFTLQWEYAPGAWAELTVSEHMDYAGDLKTLARRIAETVRFAVNQPIKLPVRPTALPAQIRLVSVYLVRSVAAGDSNWSIQLFFSDTGEPTSLGDWPLTIDAFPSSSRTGDGNLIGRPNGILDGHPARRSSHLDGGSGLQVFDVGGVYVELSTHSAEMTARLPGGLDALFRGLEINRDPAAWR